MNNELLSIDDNNAELVEFTNIISSILDKHALTKEKYIRANNSEFMKKDPRTAIMGRSKLRQKILKERTNDCKYLYDRQKKIFASAFCQKGKGNFLNN